MSRWIEFIRQRAKDDKTTYGCALSDPQTAKDYRRKYGNSKKLPKYQEQFNMGMEDVNVLKKKLTAQELMNRKYNKPYTPKQPREIEGSTHDLAIDNRKGSPTDMSMKRKAGRPKKYADSEEARKANIAKTIQNRKDKKK